MTDRSNQSYIRGSFRVRTISTPSDRRHNITFMELYVATTIFLEPSGQIRICDHIFCLEVLSVASAGRPEVGAGVYDAVAGPDEHLQLVALVRVVRPHELHRVADVQVEGRDHERVRHLGSPWLPVHIKSLTIDKDNQIEWNLDQLNGNILSSTTNMKLMNDLFNEPYKHLAC